MVIMWSPADVIENRVNFNYFLVRIYNYLLLYLQLYIEKKCQRVFLDETLHAIKCLYIEFKRAYQFLKSNLYPVYVILWLYYVCLFV